MVEKRGYHKKVGEIVRHFIASTREMFFDASGHFYLKKYDKIRVAFLVACTLGFILLSNLVAPIQFGETDTEATSQSTQPSTLTLISTTNTATVSINPTPTGVFGKSTDANSIKFNISTNNYSGYTISARTTRTTLINGSSSLTSLASAVSESQFSSSGNTTLNNRWGYKPNYYNSSANSNFLPSPGSSSSTLDHTTAANSTAKNYTIVLGARVNTEVPAGTYINDTLVLEATANAVPYTIKFNKAADDDIVSNMPSNKTGESVSANNVTLPNNVPTRVNYTFAGWCTTIPVATAGGYTCNGTTYTAGSDYEINFTVDNTDNNLYAIWTSNRGCNKAATTIGTGVTATDAVCMQDINDTIITSMTTGTQHTLIDMRDGKSYFIAKQADGKVWMTQNLDYDLSTSTTLTHNNTDLGYTTSNLSKTWTPSANTVSHEAEWTQDNVHAFSMDYGENYDYDGLNRGEDYTSTCTDSSTCAHYHIGNYYNWPAAVAENLPTVTSNYNVAEDSVCPAGWRLVKSATSSYTVNDIAIAIDVTHNIGAWLFTTTENSTALLLSDTQRATINGSPLYLVGSHYYTNVGRNATNAYNVEILNRLSNRTYNDNYNGTSIRCIARMITGTTTVNFHANGGTGTMASRTVSSGEAITITNEFEYDGHRFVKWNTAADGSGTDFPETSIRVSPNITTTFNLYAQWEEAFIIKYDGNGADSGHTMTKRHEVADGESITLAASNFRRDGYGFLGWSATQIDPDAVDFATQLANANVFGPTQTIVATPAAFNKSFPATATLYAVWIKSAGDMQDWQGCSSMSVGDVTARKDTRDNNVYAIAKLADGNCWMIENLRLDRNESTDSTKAQGFGGNFWGLANPELASFNSGLVENSLYTPNTTSTTKKIITGSNVEYRIPRFDNVPGAEDYNNQENTIFPLYSHGSRYNWPAAMANTNELATASLSQNSGTSICPSGWRLPTGGSSGEYDVLNNLVNSGLTTSSASLRKYPNNFIYAGYIWNSTTQNNHTYGYYWSSTAYNSSNAYVLSISESSSTQATKYRTVGASVRCIAASGIEIKLDANDNSNRVARLYGESSATVTIPEKQFERTGYVIASWNTSPDGSGTSYTSSYTVGSSNITLYAQWVSAYNVVYNGNNPTSNTNMDFYAHFNIADGESIQLQTPNYLRTGYGFLGWSTTQINPDASNASTLIANAKIYGPNETVEINSILAGQAAPAEITMYAVWIKSSGSLQEWQGCLDLTATSYNIGTAEITPGDVIALTDSRDGNTYAVARLSNGECWMIENLRLDIKTANITAANTNNPTNDFLTNRTTSYSWCSTEGADCAERYLNANAISVLGNGSYYNFYTSTAGNGEYESNTTAEGDICPIGWHIPLGSSGTTGYYGLVWSLGGYDYNLDSTTNPTGAKLSKRFRTYPTNITYSGETTNGTSISSIDWAKLPALNQWSNSGNYYDYYFGVSDDEIRQTYGIRKYTGLPVRCVKNQGSIIYDGNGATGSTSMSDKLHTGLNSSSTVQLFASNYQRPGYGFVGWSKTQIDPDSANAVNQIANATIWGPDETVNVSNFSSDVNTLYAVWVKSAGNLQGWTGCSSLAQGSVTALKDTRDNQVYAVAKLVDGRCWMIENLRLNDDSTDDPTKSQGYGGVFAGLANAENIHFNTQAYENSKYTGEQHSTSKIVIRDGSLYHRLPRYSNSNTTSTVSNMTTRSQNIYLYGNYYNDHAYLANTGSFMGKTEIEGTSLCPAGWKMPSKTVDYTNLLSNMGSSNATKYPNNFVHSGDMYDGIQNRGAVGYYATTTTIYVDNDNIGNYYFYINNGYGFNTQTSAYYGVAVRCVIPNNVEIKLEANDGSNRVARIYADANSTISIPFNTFDKDQSSIVSWNTAANGSGTSYSSSYTVGSSNVTLYAQWNDSYDILYDLNYPNYNFDNFMDDTHHTNVKTGDSVMLYENVTSRSNYAFLGWSITQIDPDASNANTLIANAKIFGPNETITANSTTLGVSAPAQVTLYAVWLKSSGTLQSWQGCGSLTAATYNSSTGVITPGDVIALKDSRDNKVYPVAKLADGRCWMIDQLRTDPSSADITAANTNNPTATFLANRTTTYESCTSNTQSCIERVLYNPYAANPWGTAVGYTYSYYYNWYTATAGNGTTTATTAEGDICPIGWHLPTGGTGTSSEFATLNVSVGGLRQNLDDTTTPTGGELSARLRTYPYNFLYSGQKSYTTTRTATGYREGGQLWSSNGFTSSNTYYGQYHYISDTLARLSYGYTKQNLIRIRCIKDASKVTYDGNGADSGYSMSVTHPATAGATITLYASNYKRSGYGFLGWSTTQIDPDASDFATQLSNATVYGPNQTITLPSNITDTTTLYAVWIKSAGNLQGWTGCSSLSTGGVTALKDTRDNQVYAVAKLADGKCWMIENLRLNSSSSLDVTKAQGFGGVFNGLANSELTTFAGVTTNNSLYTIDSSSTSLNVILGDNLSTRFPRYNGTNTINTVANMTSNTQNIYSYGNYYTWPAAMANTKPMSTTALSEYSGTSICPTGWRLPTAGSGKDFDNLNTVVNSGSTTSSANLRTYPNNFIYSGYVWSSAQSGYGTYGQYYSTSASSATGAYEFQIASSSVNIGRSVWKYLGDSVRCVAATGITLTLNANDGSDNVAHVYAPSGTAITLTDDTFVNEGYTIVSWNTSDSGSGTSYTTSITPSSSTTLYAQWATTYTVVYNGNGATSSSTMDSFSHEKLSNNDTVMLYSSNIKRTGYGFLGWSTTQIDPDASDFSTQLTNAKIFGPNETITANQATLGVSAPATVTLYAVWIKSSGTMQDWLGCETLTATTFSNGTITPGSVIALTDSRDSETYAIARLSDGKCWTAENLRTNPATATINASNTNAPTSTFLTNRTTSYSWCTTQSSDCAERVLSTYSSSTQYSGRYYNWYTATAGNGLQTSTGDAAGDICPKGWHLPSGSGVSGIAGQLGVSLGGPSSNASASTTPTGAVLEARFRKYPYNFQKNGYVYNNSVYSNREWSYTFGANSYKSSSNDNYYAIYSGFNDAEVRYNYGFAKYDGLQIRCIATNASDPYTISYNGNGSTGGSVTNTHSVIQGDTVRLVAPDYRRTNYGFVGWSFSSSATVGGSATIYGPNETVTMTSSILSGADNQRKLTLYAIWQAKDSTNTMQAFTEANCTSMSTGQIKVLTDSRDSNVYPIAKLADGNCWMIDNLRINPATASITASNTNNPTSAFLSARTSASSSNSWCTDNTSTSCTDTIAFRTGTWYAYGNMYNYYTATAGNGTTAYSLANGDICPTGWRLPTGKDETTAEYALLNTAVNSGSTTTSAGLRRYPNNFVYSGYMSGTSYTGNGSQGRYMTSYLFLSSGARYVPQIRIQNTSVTVNGGFGESLGIAVRCLRKKTKTYTLTYNANGGSGAPAAQSGSLTNGFANHIISGTTPTRDGYAFIGWSESSTATNASYTSGETYQTASTSATLYAVWRKEIKLTYNANGGSGGFTMTATTSGTSYTFTIASDVPTATNATFLGWADSTTATSAQYTSGNSLTISSNKTIYAVWRRTYTLDFNSDGGSPTPSTISYTTVNKTSQTFTIPSTVPTLANATFKGWSFTCSSAYPRTTGLYLAGSTYTTNAPLTTLHLCAVWEREFWIYLDYNNDKGGKGYLPTTTVYPYKFTFESYDNPEWSGHTFRGWAESATATSPTYLPGSTYTFPTGVLRKNFYAVWN